jgi:hypothetical protein
LCIVKVRPKNIDWEFIVGKLSISFNH